ncbi:MAG: hypothetical protein H7326_02805 [Bdellovibrionaceae bacterium]|nr:hypothetical protein [Pseudobdellovibrionaceae bacterium]
MTSAKRIRLMTASLMLTTGMNATAQTPPISALELQCLQSMCGDANPLSHPFDLSKKYEATTTGAISLIMKKPLEYYMGRIIHHRLLMDKSLKAVLAMKDKPKLNEKQTAFMQSLRYLGMMNQYAGTIEQSVTKGYTINAVNLKIAMPQLTDVEIAAIQTLAKPIGSMMAMQAYTTIPYVAFMKMIGSGKPVVETQIANAKTYEYIMSSMNVYMPKMDVIRTGTLVMKKAATGALLTESEGKIFIRQFISAVTIVTITDSVIQDAFKKIPATTEQLLTATMKKYGDSETALTIQSPKTLKAVFQKSLDQCIPKLAYSYAALPDRTQLETFRANFDQITQRAQTLLEKRLKTSLPGAFRLEVQAPQDRDSALGDWKYNLAVATKELDQSIQRLKKIDINDAETAQSLVVASTFTLPEKFFGDVDAFCEQAKPEFLTDKALPVYDYISLSWPTIVHPEFGFGVAAHELGHVLSRKWPDVAKAETDCLTAKQGNADRTEEDFADLFSAEIFNDSSGKLGDVKLKNFACVLNPRTEKAWAPGTLKPDDLDNHSTGLFRTIAVTAMTGTQTPTCSSYLNSQKETRFDKYCRWQK